jgi:hypothetical protein
MGVGSDEDNDVDMFSNFTYLPKYTARPPASCTRRRPSSRTWRYVLLSHQSPFTSPVFILSHPPSLPPSLHPSFPPL